MRVKAGFFSVTRRAAPDLPVADDDYLRWHLLDHMPEQYQLPGIVYGLRWIADGGYRDAAIAAAESLEHLGSVMHYLIGDPVEQTLTDFIDLGARLRELGRFRISRPSLRLAALRLQNYYSSPAALISAEGVPFRPHRGIMLLVEEPTGDRPDPWLRWLHTEHYPKLLTQPGVAGAWVFGAPYAPPATPVCWISTRHYVTVIYLDEDPRDTVDRLAPIVQRRWSSGAVRPLFAGPLRSMTTWEAWP